MDERAYTYHATIVRVPNSSDYVVETPETPFQLLVQETYLEAEQHLQNEEYGLALAAFEELQLVILGTTVPEMPLDPNAIWDKSVLVDQAMLEPLAEQAATMLN